MIFYLSPNFQTLNMFSEFMENTPLHCGSNVVTAWFEKKHYDASWSDLLMSSSFAHVNVVPYTYKVSTSQFHTYFSFIASYVQLKSGTLCTPNLKQVLLWEVGIFKTELVEKSFFIKVALAKDYLLWSPTFSRHTYAKYLQIYRTFLEFFLITLNWYCRK